MISTCLARLMRGTMLLLIPALIGLGTPAKAATLTVDSRGDRADLEPGDRRCDSAQTSGVQCTLRAAIEEANALTGTDVIRFDIGGPAAVKTITPRSKLPEITGAVAINGYSQPGARVNTLQTGNDAELRVELNGSLIPDSNGLKITAGPSVVRGLVINDFFQGIELRDSGSNKILGNFIGTDPSGSVGEGNKVNVAVANSSYNLIGSSAPRDRNLIADSEFAAISLGGASENSIAGNYIGTDRNGTADLGNATRGGYDGIRVNGISTGNRIGGLTPGAGNVIAHTDGYGVNIIGDASVANAILGNSIFDSERQGINIAGEGISINDPGDADTGGNLRQNHPVVTSAQARGSRLDVAGTLSSAAGSTYTVQFFSNPVDEEIDEGQRFLGQTTVDTNVSGDGSFAVSLSPGRIPTGSVVTATATDFDGNTSEFSPGRVVTPRLPTRGR